MLLKLSGGNIRSIEIIGDSRSRENSNRYIDGTGFIAVRRAVAVIFGLMIVSLVLLVSLYSKIVVKDYYTTGPGEMGPTVLEPGRMTIEVDYQTGYAPNDDALTQFKWRTENYTGRSVEVLKTETPIPSQKNVTIGDAVSLERRFRSVAPVEGDRVGLYLLYIGGTFKDNANVLAATYLSLSIVVFKSEITKYVPQSGPCDSIMVVNECKVERSVLVHEFGHVLGLVDLIFASPRSHHDEQNPGHCTNESCVMYHSIEIYRGGFAKSPPSGLDHDCLDDLAIVRSSSYGKYYLKDPRFVIVIAVIIGAGSGAIASLILWGRRKRRPMPSPLSPPLPETRP